jgi:hypothetical protein
MRSPVRQKYAARGPLFLPSGRPPAPPPPSRSFDRPRALVREGYAFGLHLPGVALAAHILKIGLKVRQPLFG